MARALGEGVVVRVPALAEREEPELREEAEVVAASPMLGDPAAGDPPDVDVPDGERPARRPGAHQRTRVAPAHRHQLDDLVALGNLVLDLKAKLAERALEAPHRLLDALGTSRLLRVRRLVVHEVGVDEFVRELDITLREDLAERAADQPLVVLRRHRRLRLAVQPAPGRC